jgi:hypothetical protein
MDTASLVGELPLHGPYDPVRTTNAAHLVHELVRYLNYATMHAAGSPGAIEASEMVGALRSAVAKLPQVFTQVGRHLPESPAAAGALGEAGVLALSLAGRLSAVQRVLHDGEVPAALAA